MGYVFDFNDAKNYGRWLDKPANRLITDLQRRLALNLLEPLPGKTLLDIGCGTGVSAEPFVAAGLQVTGIDPSPYMLDIAAGKLGPRVDLHRGVAENLPFDDNSFHYASLITTLEFVENPQQAIAEACRVARHKVFLGVMNKYAIQGVQLRIKGVFTQSIYNRAHFYSVWELKQMIRSLVGNVPISWRTVCHLPSAYGIFAGRFERFSLVQRCPFGLFAGMVVTLVPRFTTRPLTISAPRRQPAN